MPGKAAPIPAGLKAAMNNLVNKKKGTTTTNSVVSPPGEKK